MRFDATQLEAYDREGYVIVDCPFPAQMTQRCLDAVAAVAIDPATNTGDGKRNHFRLQPQVDGSYWCDLDHSLPFLQIELHAEIVELARQLAGDDDIYFRNGGINELAPGRSFLWHRDAEDEYVEFMHYFSGADPNSGCLRVIPGTQVGPAHDLQAEVASGARCEETRSVPPGKEKRTWRCPARSLWPWAPGSCWCAARASSTPPGSTTRPRAG